MAQRQVLAFPSLWTKVVGIVAIEVLSPLHGVDGISYSVAFANQNWRFAVRATTLGKDGGLLRAAHVDWDWWEESEGYVDAVVRVTPIVPDI